MSKKESSNYLFNLARRNRILEKLYLKKITKREGGEQVSNTLRMYYRSKYKVFVDLYSYGCFKPEFNCGGNMVTVGRYCSISPNVRYYGANHPQDNFSLSPYFYNKAFGLDVQDVDRYELEIGNDVWIGYGVIITAGCKRIGDGAIIGAGSVVTNDVDAYEVVAGNPARLIKRRFSDDIVARLEKSCWWEYTPAQLHQTDSYGNINKFLECIENITWGGVNIHD